MGLEGTGESTSVSWDTFDEKKGKFYDKESDWKFNNAYKNNEEVDFSVISGESKEGKEIADKLGITAKPGFPIKESGKADLKVVKTPKKKDAFGIRLMKNFDQDLTDEGLAQEGYNLQEIDILKRARAVMKDPEKDVRHPTEALRWVRGDMADEAGVDIDEFMTDFNWDDKYAQGGGVGSMFRRV